MRSLAESGSGCRWMGSSTKPCFKAQAAGQGGRRRGNRAPRLDSRPWEGRAGSFFLPFVSFRFFSFLSSLFVYFRCILFCLILRIWHPAARTQSGEGVLEGKEGRKNSKHASERFVEKITQGTGSLGRFSTSSLARSNFERADYNSSRNTRGLTIYFKVRNDLSTRWIDLFEECHLLFWHGHPCCRREVEP